MEKKFRIIEVNEVTAKNGNKFSAYKTLANGGRKMDVRFTRNCHNVPVEPCIVVCNEEDCNVDTSRQYPILWVKEVIRIEPYKRKNNIADFFSDIVDDEELSF